MTRDMPPKHSVRLTKSFSKRPARPRHSAARCRPRAPLTSPNPWKGAIRMANLSHKSALATGASRGIGRAVALALAEAGAEVIVHYGASAAEAHAVVAQIAAAGGRAHAVGADLAAPDGPADLARQVRAIVGERLDILVANAGVARSASIEET